MPAFTFLFSAALWALPVAGLPVLLHLLFRRKSPVVRFPTLRFIKASMQQTAARKKVHRWLLLLCRALALALLVWAISQPSIRPDAAWAGGGKSSIAVIVLDTSYSMQLKDGGMMLAARADQAVRDLLAGQLRGMKVAILRSAPAPTDRPEAKELRDQEILRDVAAIHWTTPTPQAASVPLVERVAAATALLNRQPADDKWLIVISDFQAREFPRTLPQPKDARLILVDLHPQEVRSAGITRLTMSPSQPTPGLPSELIIDVSGRPRDVRQLNLSTTSLEDEKKTDLQREPVNLDDSGHARIRTPIAIPARGWVKVEAALSGDEPLAWAKSRDLLVQAPPRQQVVVLDGPEFAAARQRVAWALDPSGGADSSWALSVRVASDFGVDADAAVLLAAEWPSVEQATRLRDFARRGNTVILFLRPGLEETWPALPLSQRTILAELLAALPFANPSAATSYHAGIGTPPDVVLRGLTDERFQIRSMTVTRLLPFGDLLPDASVVLTANALEAQRGPRPSGLTFRRTLGAGTVFTFATLPDVHYGKPYLNQTFPPMLAQMCLRPLGRSGAQNMELGAAMTIGGNKFDLLPQLRVQGPQGDLIIVAATMTPGGERIFAYDRADSPGIYAWQNSGDGSILAMTNVQLPGDEAELRYAAADRQTAEGTSPITVRSAAELSERLANLSQPEPKWAVALAAVMTLLCLEALIGSAPAGSAPRWLPKWPLSRRQPAAR